jgi:hypothetical protein
MSKQDRPKLYMRVYYGNRYLGERGVKMAPDEKTQLAEQTPEDAVTLSVKLTGDPKAIELIRRGGMKDSGFEIGVYMNPEVDPTAYLDAQPLGDTTFTCTYTNSTIDPYADQNLSEPEPPADPPALIQGT